jgi:hypothetical protein
MRVIIDDRADPVQRDALYKIMLGVETEEMATRSRRSSAGHRIPARRAGEWYDNDHRDVAVPGLSGSHSISPPFISATKAWSIRLGAVLASPRQTERPLTGRSANE